MTGYRATAVVAATTIAMVAANAQAGQAAQVQSSAQAQGAPAQAQGAPAQAQGATAQAQGAPAQAQGAPAQAQSQAQGVPAQAHVQSVQQAFDAAVALDGSGTPAARLAAWEALEPRVATNRRSRAIVRLRKAKTLFALQRGNEAVAALTTGLAELPESDPVLREDRFLALLTLGQFAQASTDYAAAMRFYRDADPLATAPADRLSLLLGLVKVETYLDPAAAALSLARADEIVANAKVDPVVQARLRLLDAELRMNRGEFPAAQQQAGIAVKLLGGLTERTNIDDVRARSDFAIAALLAGKKDQARQYLAMSGAGRKRGASFNIGSWYMTPPDCGGEAGLKPADLAVVEFSIGDDGSVIQAEPVYAAGGGAVALEFVRAVRQWAWKPEAVKAIDPFYRYRIRVEMRCSTGFERPSIESYLDEQLGRWLDGKGVPLPDPASGNDIAALPVLRRQLAAAEAASGQASLKLVPILQFIARNRVAPRDEAHAAAVRALAIADANDATGLPRLAIETAAVETQDVEKKQPHYVDIMQGLLARPAYAGDPEARAALRLLIAQAQRAKIAVARPLLNQIARDPALPKDNALRASALVQLASLEEKDGNAAAARAAFAQSGLNPTQCAVVDTPPELLHAGGTFPMEAMQWGFEGFTRIQFDIAADGKVQNERTVLAYPAFVFSKAGSETMRTAQFAKSYRPDGGLGCGGRIQLVRFGLPE